MLGGVGDMHAADQWIDNWNARIQSRSAATIALVRGWNGLQGSARGAHGNVNVTVDAAGALLTLQLDDDLHDQPVEQTSSQIMAAIESACAEVVYEATQLAAHTVTDGSASGEALVAGVTAEAGENPSPAGALISLRTRDDVAEVLIRPSGRLMELRLSEHFRAQPAQDTARSLLELTQRVRAERHRN